VIRPSKLDHLLLTDTEQTPLAQCYRQENPRGGVVSERHVHPCGMRPRPTGRDTLLDTLTPSALANKLLATLPRAVFETLKTHFTIVPMAQGTLLFEADEEIDQIFFPLSGMISLLVVLKTGNAIETATVGREGVVGAMAGLGLHRSRVRGVIQLPGTVARIAAAQFRKAALTSPAISNLCFGYNEVLLSQARITAACNLSHGIEARFCRWLLQCRDRAESDAVPLTQEFLSEMLGVRRTSVTEVAIKMQDKGVIRYTRGIIHIVDLQKLRDLSCECYETLRAETSS
jgi:CRP-like cAMP-binding protein